MRRSRRRRQTGLGIAIAAFAVTALALGYWAFRDLEGDTFERAVAGTNDLASPAALNQASTDNPAAPKTSKPASAAETASKRPQGAKPTVRPTALTATRLNEINQVWKRYQAGQVIAARHELNAMLSNSGTAEEQNRLRGYLTQIANETIFSSRRLEDDPLIGTYKVESGDYLSTIGKKHKVPYQALMRVNGIRDATRLRADRNIKVLNGPFHAKIDKSGFRLDLYLQDLYVRSFPIAIGIDGGTPLGVWRVKNKLEDPTYYPPAGAGNKRIIAAGDPKNPLGEHWIGLEGIEGDAVGQMGYGIHGTIEPESIGKAVSLGCVRMRNADVAFLYSLLQPGDSTVTTLP